MPHLNPIDGGGMGGQREEKERKKLELNSSSPSISNHEGDFNELGIEGARVCARKVRDR